MREFEDLAKRAKAKRRVLPIRKQRYWTRVIRAGSLMVLVAAVIAARFVPWWLATGLALVAIYYLIELFLGRYRRDVVQTYFSRARDRGLAGRLFGRIGYAVVWVQPSIQKRKERRSTLRALHRGLSFLRKEASSYGKELAFSQVKGRFVIEIDAPPPEPRVPKISDAEKAVKKAVAAMPFWQQASAYDGFFAVVITNWPDYHASAFMLSEGSTREDGAKEMCLCTPSDCRHVFAHEVLHLFGAQDLYLDPSEAMVDRNRTIEEMRGLLEEVHSYEVPRASIMNNGLHGRDSHVDAPNAYAVGWTEELLPT